MRPQHSKSNWAGPKHLEEFADWVNHWPVNAFTGPVDKLKASLDGLFTRDAFAAKLKITMDPYLSTRNETNTPCPDDCKCCNCAHIRKFFVGHPFTPGDFAEWKEGFDTAVAARKAKAEKAAERKKAKRAAQKARKKAAAAAASESDGDGDDEESVSPSGEADRITTTAVAPRLAPDTNTKPTAAHKPGTASFHASAEHMLARLLDTNYLCPLCSPCTALICKKKHFGLPNDAAHDHWDGLH
ncbi:uncharacterized protein LOC62_07G009475 [Vanrija pseudolonga]|uniref:Uncharacterized protein n=1 Tax=Vanrija pseudolonga TaxID=143232 RepID=A0AAF0YGJ1_9TREE|nr:hypothetical protein LOC62_07G009475 [Vanrija pseudolonga]